MGEFMKPDPRWCLIALAVALPSFAQIATVPYVENFESPTWPGAEWIRTVSVPTSGRILTATPNTPSPQGGLACNFDCSTSAILSTQELTLTVNVLATGGATLRYYAKETADEPHAEDGCFINDGILANWVKVVDHQTLSSAWQQFTVDIAAAASANGMQLTSNFKIKFSQRDDNPTPTDGLQIDNVRVDPPPVPDTGQANAADAGLDVNGALNLLGQASGNGVKGPFFATKATGAQLTFTVRGLANQIFLLLAGPLHRNNWVVPNLGSLDIGLLGPGNLGDVVIVLDGTSPIGFNAFATTGPAGQSVTSLFVPALPPGVWTTFQAAVFSSPTTVKLTAATQLTVQ